MDRQRVLGLRTYPYPSLLLSRRLFPSLCSGSSAATLEQKRWYRLAANTLLVLATSSLQQLVFQQLVRFQLCRVSYHMLLQGIILEATNDDSQLDRVIKLLACLGPVAADKFLQEGDLRFNVKVPTERLANRGLYSLTSLRDTSNPFPRSVFWTMSRARPWSNITKV